MTKRRLVFASGLTVEFMTEDDGAFRQRYTPLNMGHLSMVVDTEHGPAVLTDYGSGPAGGVFVEPRGSGE